MTKNIEMYMLFGDFCADGDKATKFFVDEIKPTIDEHESIEFDFEKVRNMNSSFSNALFGNIVGIYGADILELIAFRNCNDTVKLLVSSGLELGLRRNSGDTTH